jgi:hypothetical protein
MVSCDGIINIFLLLLLRWRNHRLAMAWTRAGGWTCAWARAWARTCPLWFSYQKSPRDVFVSIELRLLFGGGKGKGQVEAFYSWLALEGALTELLVVDWIGGTLAEIPLI